VLEDPWVSRHIGFFVSPTDEIVKMRVTMTGQATTGMAQQIARAAIDFEVTRTGRVPKSISVVVGPESVVITLHESLSRAERALAQSPSGAAQVQELHRRLFDASSNSLRQEIKRITGVDVRDASVDVETADGSVVKAFNSGTVVQMFLLAHGVPTDTWSGN
jgi:uncharacterized protein YbcI